ncbi:unnamed protein product [Linum tenue]|uniref:Uncharacterized protein n=1 Tax=Linum tenue TaxID=586396 RepID=A0AAV0NHM3_9ROSI|nr:unnamed protein product [Linum tenue]
MSDKINDVDVRTEETKPLRGFFMGKEGQSGEVQHFAGPCP